MATASPAVDETWDAVGLAAGIEYTLYGVSSSSDGITCSNPLDFTAAGEAPRRERIQFYPSMDYRFQPDPSVRATRARFALRADPPLTAVSETTVPIDGGGAFRGTVTCSFAGDGVLEVVDASPGSTGAVLDRTPIECGTPDGVDEGYADETPRSVAPAAPDTPGRSPLPRLRGGSVHARVERGTSGYFQYRYRVAIGPTERLLVDEFTIEVDRGVGRAVLDAKGLPPEAAMVLPSTRRERERTIDKAVALSISGVPPAWSAGIDRAARVRWGANLDRSRIRPREQLDGFEISSRAIPGIRAARLEPDLDRFLPNVEVDPDAESVYEQIPASTQVAMTVGPTAPPDPFVPRAFADEIATMLDAARAQGWIATEDAKASLDANLSKLKTALDARDFDDARASATAFLDATAENPSLSSEAYALMRFNMEHLRARIPTTIRTSVIESDEELDSLIAHEVFRGEAMIGDEGGTVWRELTLAQDRAGPRQSAQFGWPRGVAIPFVFSFDGRAAWFEIGGGGRSLRTESRVFPLPVVPETLFVRARVGAADASVTVSDLVLDGVPIAETVVADAGVAGLGILRVEASELGDGFALAGNIRMEWTGAQPSGSDISVQLRAATAASAAH